MEVLLPNFQTLEERIKQLSEEIREIRSGNQPREGGVGAMSREVGERVVQKIRHLLDLLDEF